MMSAIDKILKIYMKICMTIRYTFASFCFQVPSLNYEKYQFSDLKYTILSQILD